MCYACHRGLRAAVIARLTGPVIDLTAPNPPITTGLVCGSCRQESAGWIPLRQLDCIIESLLAKT